MQNELEANRLEIRHVSGVPGAEDNVLSASLEPHLFAVLLEVLELNKVPVLLLVLNEFALSALINL